MSEEDAPSISLAQLPKVLETYFDENELRDLCFQLQVDYENLPPGGKKDKARELVILMQRHSRIVELAELVQQLRPYIGLNVQKLAGELFPAGDPRLQGLNSLLDQFRAYYEKLREWKELHNHLDETLNVFGQYAAQVERFAGKGEAVEPDMLLISWQPVSRRAERMLLWAEQDIHHIGRPFQTLDTGEKTGEKWAIETSELCQAISQYLQSIPTTPTSGGWQRIFASRDDPWPHWWRELRDLTRTFDNALKNHMYVADKELRKTASDLHDLSKEALWS